MFDAAEGTLGGEWPAFVVPNEIASKFPHWLPTSSIELRVLDAEMGDR